MVDTPFYLHQLPSIDEAQEIIPYEPAKTIAWAKFIEDTWCLEGYVKKVHIGTVSGKPAWSDGHFLVIGEPPARLKALKKYYEVHDPEGRPRDFDHLIPEIPPRRRAVKPLATIVQGEPHPDIVYLSDYAMRYETCIQKEYVDYFVIHYPDAEFFPTWYVGAKVEAPLVVTEKADMPPEEKLVRAIFLMPREAAIVGVVMPIRIDPSVLERTRRFVKAKAPPVTPPPVEPPVKSRKEQIMEMDHNHTLDELKRMARERGVSPSGTKHEIIERLLSEVNHA